jgi:hypothetical protein
MNRFQTTRWSLVLDAGKDPAQARVALESLCRTYRPPVHAYIRGHHYTAPVRRRPDPGVFRPLNRADADNGRGMVAMQWHTLRRFWHAFASRAGWKPQQVTFNANYRPEPVRKPVGPN